MQKRTFRQASRKKYAQKATAGSAMVPPCASALREFPIEKTVRSEYISLRCGILYRNFPEPQTETRGRALQKEPALRSIGDFRPRFLVNAITRRSGSRNPKGPEFTRTAPPAGYSAFSKASLPTPQIGQTQSSGRSEKAVPGAIPLSGSPAAGS